MRQYQGGGVRGPWIGTEPDGYVPFQRADGSVMTDEEIKAVATTQQVDPKRLEAARAEGVKSSLRGRNPVDPDAVWAAVERLGTQSAAAKDLGISQGAIQSGLKRYMRDHGLDGPLPGLLRPRDTQTPAPASEPNVEAVDELPKTLTEAFMNGASESAGQPIVAIVHHGDPDARAAAWNEGYAAAKRVVGDRSIEALVEWLVLNAEGWTDAQAERWLKAFTATIDLVYPTRAAS